MNGDNKNTEDPKPIWFALTVDWQDSEMFDEATHGERLAWVCLICHVKKTGRKGTAKFRKNVFQNQYRLSQRAVDGLLERAQKWGAVKLCDGHITLCNWDTYQYVTQKKKKPNVGESRGSPEKPATNHQSPVTSHQVPSTARTTPKKEKGSAVHREISQNHRACDARKSDPIRLLRAVEKIQKDSDVSAKRTPEVIAAIRVIDKHQDALEKVTEVLDRSCKLHVNPIKRGGYVAEALIKTALQLTGSIK